VPALCRYRLPTETPVSSVTVARYVSIKWLFGYDAASPTAAGGHCKYGIVAVEESANGQRMTRIVEKPNPDDAPSDLAVVGR